MAIIRDERSLMAWERFSWIMVGTLTVRALIHKRGDVNDAAQANLMV
jgi:hypothetical protein